MIDDGERRARADDYVFGRMNESERERAERDLERDARFRDAVVRTAERMQGSAVARPANAATDTMWQEISNRIGAMPQMRASRLATDDTARLPGDTAKRFGLHAASGWRQLLIAACLMGALAIGYVAGVVSGGPRGLWPF